MSGRGDSPGFWFQTPVARDDEEMPIDDDELVELADELAADGDLDIEPDERDD